MPLSAGDKLGPYEIVGPLGAGGMGEVYRARDTKLKREVALKVLPEAFARNADRMARFQREAEVLASLNHPNIAHIYGVEESRASSWSWSRAKRSRRSSREARCPWRRRSTTRSKSPTRSKPRTIRASCIAT